MANFQHPVSHILLVISLLTLCLTLALYFNMISSPATNYISQNTKYTTIFNNNFTIHKTIHVINNNSSAEKKYIVKSIDNALNNNVHTNFVNADSVTESFKRSADPRSGKGNSNGDPHSNSNGRILVSLYAEQQVGAAMNMFSLQKWAKYVGVSVIEPFVQNSMLRLPIVFSQQQLDTKLRFRDYVNIDIWNNMSTVMNGTPLVPWESFVDQAPKKFIFVAIINSLRKEEREIYIDDEIVNQEYCNDTFYYFTNKYRFYINRLQTKMVRRVCLSFYKTIMDIDKFTSAIYGNISPSDVIVWFQIWKGFSKNNRVRIVQQHFHRSRETLSMLHTSKRISDDSQKYIKEFLKSEPGKYTAISIRTMLRGKYLPRSNHTSFFHNCIKELGGVIKSPNISDSTKFLAMDLGRFGDSIVENYIYKYIIKNIEADLFQTIYNNSLTMWKWEQSFIQATNGITDTGYIAAMQRTIVENGQCLVLFGGRSNFQRTLLLTYKEKNANKTCIYEVCYEK